MLRTEHRGTVRAMSIRAVIRGLLAGDGELSDPAASLEEAGYDNIPAEAFGTALESFSDTATLDEADALAPLVTRTGPIPFEESDLPEIDLDVDTGDAFSLFASTVTPVHQDFGDTDLDDADDLDDESDPESSVDGEHLDLSGETDFDFGQPSSQLGAQDSTEDPSDEQALELSKQTSVFGSDEQVQPFDEESEPAPTDSVERLSDDDPDDHDGPFEDELEIDL